MYVYIFGERFNKHRVFTLPCLDESGHTDVGNLAYFFSRCVRISSVMTQFPISKRNNEKFVGKSLVTVGPNWTLLVMVSSIKGQSHTSNCVPGINVER